MRLLETLIHSGLYSPLSVTVSLAGSCNGHCLYCQIRNRPFAPMPFENAVELLRCLSRRGTQRIGFTQDEPLLYLRLGDILREARRLFRFVTLGSNGLLVADRISELAQGRLNSLVLPLDGPPHIHDSHRGAGAYSSVEKASEAAHLHNIPLWFTCVLAADNLVFLEDTLQLAEKLGGRLHVQPLYHDSGIAGDTAALSPEHSEIVRTVETLIRLKKEGRALLNSLASLGVMHRWPDFSRTRLDAGQAQNYGLPRCRGALLFAHISSTGAIYPCTEEIGDAPNVFELGLPEALQRLRSSECVCKYSCRGSDYLEYNLLAAPKLSAWENLLDIWLAYPARR